MKESSSPHDRPVLTRGLRREQAKRERKRARVRDALVVGIDLARQRQAVSFATEHQIAGRLRFDCMPEELDRLLPRADAIREDHGLSRVVVAMEPAGHYWGLAAEAFERAGVDYVLVHPLSVKREREGTRYTPEKTDPRDADLIAMLALRGKFTETQLFDTTEEAALNALAREYFRVRKASAAERTRLHNFWHRMLPEFFTFFREPTGQTVLAISRALGPLSKIADLTESEWKKRIRAHARGRKILINRAIQLLPLLKAAHEDPHRRTGEGLPWRIRMAAERRTLLEEQKAEIRAEVLSRYRELEDAVYLDSIPGSHPFYNALTLALVGDFHAYDDPRAIVKLAGTEVNEYASGDYRGRSRISHRGRSLLRAAAYQQARILVSRSDDFRSRYYRLLHRTDRRRLTELQCYVAIMNSYLRTAHVLVTKRELYVPLAERQEVYAR